MDFKGPLKFAGLVPVLNYTVKNVFEVGGPVKGTGLYYNTYFGPKMVA